MKHLTLPLVLAAAAAATAPGCAGMDARERNDRHHADRAEAARAAAERSARVYDISRLIPVTLDPSGRKSARNTLGELIREGIGSYEEWAFTNRSTLNFAGHQLIVKTTDANHARLAELLAALEPLEG